MAALPLAAQAKDLPVGKHDNHAPIEVTSDTLEVMQEKDQAVFSGHVVAIQGDIRLKADAMTVHYRHNDDGKAPSAGGAVKKASTTDAGAIKRIDADGSVFLSTAQETASGARGIYDVEKRVITLTNNVVLTRGQNVLKGDSLVYNFDTGKSTLNGGTSAVTDTGGKSSGRVRALFVPENNKDKK